MDSLRFSFVICVIFSLHSSFAQIDTRNSEVFDFDIIKSLRHCIVQKDKLNCLAKKVIEKLDNELKSNRTIEVSDGVYIKKDPDWQANSVYSQRSYKGMTVNEMLSTKLNDYLKSLVIQFKLNDDNVVESRKKKHKHFMQMLLYGGIGIFGIMAQLFIGKLAIMSGAALMFSKIALVLAILAGLKKLTSGGGENHVVLSTDHGGQHGGWSRSTVAQDMAFRGQRQRPIMEINPSMGYAVYEDSLKGEMDPSGK